jgi:hypothetical protein
MSFSVSVDDSVVFAALDIEAWAVFFVNRKDSTLSIRRSVKEATPTLALCAGD